MLTQNRQKGKEEEPCWPSRPLAGLVVAEQKAMLCVSSRCAHENNHSLGGQSGRSEGSQCLRAPQLSSRNPTEHLQE